MKKRKTKQLLNFEDHNKREMLLDGGTRQWLVK